MIKRENFLDTDGTDLLPYIIGSYAIGIGLLGYCIYKIRKINKEPLIHISEERD